MKCPVRARFAVRGADVHAESVRDCLEAECAWWDKDAGKCAALLMSQNLQLLMGIMSAIEQKMPYELQFRRR